MLNGRSRFVTSCRYAAPSSRDLDPSSVVPCIVSCSNAPPTVTTLPPDSRRFARPSSPARVTQSELENADYCAAAGLTGHTICNTRNENAPERVACDNYLSGIADTGMPGPNWFEDVDNNGKLVKCGEAG